MKLHWIEVENWRQHSSKRIDFNDRATVIYGPNESGKSTIFEALSRGLFDKSSSSADAIQRIKPRTASRNVSSTIRMECTLSGTRYRIEKTFNLRKGTLLQKIVGGKSILLAQHDEADRQLIELLEAHLPTRASRPSNWGAFRWLWAPQDSRELPDNKDGDPTTCLHLETKDSPVLLVTPKFQFVLDRTRLCWSSYFTSRGQLKKGSPISELDDSIQILRSHEFELRTKMDKVNGDMQRLEELEQELPKLETKVSETKQEFAQARSEVVDLSSVESELEHATTKVKEAERDVSEAETALKQLKESEREVERLQVDQKKARDRVSHLEALCEQVEKGYKEKQRAVEAVATQVRQAEELTRDARILWTAADTSDKIAMVQKKIKKLTAIEKEVRLLRQQEIAVVPTSDEIVKLRKSDARIKALQETLAEIGLGIALSPGTEGSLDVMVDGEILEAGRLSATGIESVRISTPCLGHVVVKAELEHARDAKEDIASLTSAMERTLGKYGASSIDELQEMLTKQDEISKAVMKLLAEAKGIDERTLKDLNSELKKLQRKLEGCNTQERTPLAAQSNLTDGDLGKLVNRREKEETKARTLLDELREQRDKAGTDWMQKKEELAESRANEGHISENLDRVRNNERERIRSFGSIQHQERILSGARAALAKGKDEFERVRRHYDDLKRGPVSRVNRLEKQLDNQELLLRQHVSVMDHLRGAIDNASLEGTYTELAETATRLEALEERLESERMRAESYTLLKQELEDQYRSALSTLVGPIREDVVRTLSYATGFLHEDVELNEYLFPTRLGERGFDDVLLEFEDASSGLKELLALCIRVAIAKHLCDKDPQCLVLDDPFIHVSTDRSNKMIESINRAMQEHDLQLVVFTHRPMEFAGFEGGMICIQTD